MLRSRYLKPETMEGLRRLQLLPDIAVEGSFSASHRSRQRGQAAEFARFQPYTPGDDVRHLDWKVLGRTGRRYLRTYEHETDVTCTIVLDVSGSMQFPADGPAAAAGSKLEHARRIAAAMLFVLVSGRDRAGLVLISDGVVSHLPPGGTPAHLQQALDLLERDVPVGAKTRVAEALSDLLPVLRKRGVLFVLSDLMVADPVALFNTLRLYRERQFQVFLVHPVHPDEERLPADGTYLFEDLEGGGSIACSPAEIAEAYASAFARRTQRAHDLAVGVGCHHRLVSTRSEPLEVLREYLAPVRSTRTMAARR